MVPYDLTVTLITNCRFRKKAEFSVRVLCAADIKFQAGLLRVVDGVLGPAHRRSLRNAHASQFADRGSAVTSQHQIMGDEEKPQVDHLNLKVVTQDGNEIFFKCAAVPSPRLPTPPGAGQQRGYHQQALPPIGAQYGR